MKRLNLLMPFIAIAGLAAMQTTQAAVFDFGNIAETEGEAGFAVYTRTEDDLTVTATASSIDGSTQYHAYLDEFYQGRPGGLGVCKQLTADDQCTPSFDDNVSPGEMLTLEFSAEVNIEQWFFRESEHFTEFDPDAVFQISVDDGAFQTLSLQHMVETLLTGQKFELIAGLDTTPEDDFSNRFYVESVSANKTGPNPPPVPEPETFGLLGLGLTAFGLMQRRRRLQPRS